MRNLSVDFIGCTAFAVPSRTAYGTFEVLRLAAFAPLAPSGAAELAPAVATADSCVATSEPVASRTAIPSRRRTVDIKSLPVNCVGLSVLADVPPENRTRR